MASTPVLQTAFDVRGFGAIGDGQTLNTRAIQASIDACQANGGGTILIPAGEFVSGALVLHDNTCLFLESGAVLLGSQDTNDYPLVENRWEGRQQTTYAPLISGSRLKNVTIAGRGTIDGRGEPWWKSFQEKSLAYPRPRLVSFSDCTNVQIETVTLRNSPSWTIHPVRCTSVSVREVTILNPPDSPNTDGIDPDSCSGVRISSCHISAGDDCIAIKSGTEDETVELLQACRDITISGCTFERGHGGVVIGSEMSGGVRNVLISGCIFLDTDRGIRLKTRRGRGGVVENIRAANLLMDGVLCPFAINMHYACGQWGNPLVSAREAREIDAGTPVFRRISIRQVTAARAKIAASFVEGLAEMPVEDLSFADVQVFLDPTGEAGCPEMADGIPSMQRSGFFIRNVRELALEGVHVFGEDGPAFQIQDSSLRETP